MPLNDECILRHRKKGNITCELCSKSYTFQIETLVGVESLTREVADKVTSIDKWEPYKTKVKRAVWYGIHENCNNAIEHGVLGIDCKKKKALQSDLNFNYEQFVKREWFKSQIPIDVTLCVHREFFVIGVHDYGRGFSHECLNYKNLSDSQLMDTSGRGLFILHNIGFELRWNDLGNSILCSFKNPSCNGSSTNRHESESEKTDGTGSALPNFGASL